jgi:hypothetical protein
VVHAGADERLVITALLTITGYGLCNTYGQLHG